MQKIRVCHLTTAHEPFDDRIFHKECKSLLNAGYDISIIVQHDNDDIIDGIKIISLRKARNRFSRIFIVNIQLLYKALIRKADIYHFHDPELLLVGVLLKLLTFKKIIYDAHEDYGNKILSKKWIKQIFRKPIALCVNYIERASCLFFDYIFVADSHTLLKFDRHKSDVLANYPPLDFISNSRQEHSNEQLRVIYAGGISADRGIYKMLEAMRQLKGKNIEFHLLGDIYDDDILKHINVCTNVIYHGSKPWKDVSQYLLQADIGVVLLQPVPAYLYCPGENIIKLFEYMLAGLCVLISDFPKLSKLVKDIDCGISVDPTDPIKIANAIEYLYENVELRKKMGTNGRKSVVDKLNWNNESKKLLEVYRNLTLG